MDKFIQAGKKVDTLLSLQAVGLRDFGGRKLLFCLGDELVQYGAVILSSNKNSLKIANSYLRLFKDFLEGKRTSQIAWVISFHVPYSVVSRVKHLRKGDI